MAVLSPSPSALPHPFPRSAGVPQRPPRPQAAPARHELPALRPGSAGLPRRMPTAALALVLGLFAAFLVTLVASGITGSPQVPAATRPVPAGPAESAAYPAWTVQPGDTLWSIAQRVSPQADPRAVVLQLQVLNGVSPGHVLQPGEVLQLPRAGR